ncbi:hypothetical protein D3C81_1710080 [compost metagenome]
MILERGPSYDEVEDFGRFNALCKQMAAIALRPGEQRRDPGERIGKRVEVFLADGQQGNFVDHAVPSMAQAFARSRCASGPTAIAIFPCRPLSERSSRAWARGMSARE